MLVSLYSTLHFGYLTHTVRPHVALNSTKVPRRANTGRHGSNTSAHDPRQDHHANVGTRWPPIEPTRRVAAACVPRRAIMAGVPDHPCAQTRTAVTARITAHVTRGWPHLGEPDVTHRGRFCYVAARLPGHRQPQPILRLRYH